MQRLILFLAVLLVLSAIQIDVCQWERNNWTKYLQGVDVDTVSRVNIELNCLNYIPEEIFKMNKLEFLSIDVFIEGKVIPDSIGRLTKLKTLILAKSKIQNIPAEIGKLKNLEYLFIGGGGKLTSVPAEIGQCRSLKKIDFFRNSLTSLPDQIGQLENLQYLNLIENKLNSDERERIKKLLPNCKIRFDY